MPINNPDMFTLIVMFLVSFASGVVGILNKIAQGRAYSITWVTGEFIAALLCGYLAYDTYPRLVDVLPEWIGVSIFVATCSYTGGKMLQIAGNTLSRYVEKWGGHK